jgi:hypothetical protein
MLKTKLYPFILVILIIGLPACENYIRRRVVFGIAAIVPDRDVIAQGDPVNITAVFEILGATNESRPSVVWESESGHFENPNILSTVWIAPADFLGDVKIKLTATFMGHTDVAERAVRIVKTPAAGYGSLSGNIFSEGQTALNNIIVMASTGESDTTDMNGYFYISALPTGNNGLKFSGIPYTWATELPQYIPIVTGTHQHLGNILFYTSTPAKIISYQSLPEHNAILSLEHKNLNLINVHELYRANDVNGSGAELLMTVEPPLMEVPVQEESKNAFYALKSIPLNGETSTFSAWTHVSFINVVDPDADGSIFSYNNFFSATLSWQLTGYESYYKGFKVVEDRDTGWAYVSPLLGVGVQSYQLETQPGQSGDYYVLAISNNDLYNEDQPEEQKITLDVPGLDTPGNFRGRVLGDNSIRLLWEPLANNDDWYSGYFLEKKVVTDTSTIDWEELDRIPTSITSEFSDEDTDPGNFYHYRIRSVAYPPGPDGIYYSEMDSITLSTK